MAQLELDDIQGIIARGYGNLPSACYMLLQITDANKARDWIASISDRITPGDERPDDHSLHIAFTFDGLQKLGLSESELATFSREFWEGMADPNRAAFLGDVNESAPENWRWGRPDQPLDFLLMLFARDDDELERQYDGIRSSLNGALELKRLDTYVFDSPLEHFGFVDGIAQPIIDGLSRSGPPENTLAAGEFILGYDNEYARLPASPQVATERDPTEALPRRTREDGGEVADFGRNGTYLVFRQLSQDVYRFWRFVSEASKELYGSSDHQKRLRIGSKMVGRWPSGAPITLCPDEDDLEKATRDNFGYRETDATGHGCPLGAHIRRTNPRDALEGSVEESITVSNRHRILRRGRPYGAPVSRTLDVDEILDEGNPHDECGLHFIGINSDIARHFEFIQHTWINNPKFAGLYTDSDPLMGNHDPENGTFTLQSSPVRKRITAMERFVQVRGGAYFFLPGLRALGFLTTLR